mmetsp:Transcript_6821/g.12205  ORF Transcript_6821/g.12205 Transcript_6821/m.12205 type:complete len:326 (+) Transcript_6821:186-1163(+)
MTECIVKQCTICLSKLAKYRCPKCEIETCSVDCVKAHKSQTGCNGIRKRDEYISKSEYDESAWISDLLLLQDTSQHVSLAKRKRNDYESKKHKFNQMDQENGFVVKDELVKRALTKNILLIRAPHGLSKRKSSHVSFRKRKAPQSTHASSDCMHPESVEFFWSVQVCVRNVQLVNESEESRTFYLHKLHEDVPMKEIISRSLKSIEKQKQSDDAECDDVSMCSVYIKAEKCRGKADAAESFRKLNPDQTLQQVLTGSVVYEVPFFLITTTEQYIEEPCDQCWENSVKYAQEILCVNKDSFQRPGEADDEVKTNAKCSVHACSNLN